MDFCPEKGEIVSIIGPNGAAKTAFFNTLTGIYTPEDGQIVLSDTAEKLRSYEIVQKAYLGIE